MNDLQELLNNSDIKVDPAELQNLPDIDISEIDDEALKLAMDTVDNLSRVYYNEEFMAENPRLKKRIDGEIESMRVLIKMRKSDEKIHDLLMVSISTNPNNASLYRALTQIQANMLSIQKQMDETIGNLNGLLKSYQLEINFAKQELEIEEETQDGLVHRGSKSFIEQMRNRKAAETELDENAS